MTFQVKSSTISSYRSESCLTSIFCSYQKEKVLLIKNNKLPPMWDQTVKVFRDSIYWEDWKITAESKYNRCNEQNENKNCTHSDLSNEKSIQMGNGNLIKDYHKTHKDKERFKENPKIHQELIVGYSFVTSSLKCVCKNCGCATCIAKKTEEITGCNISVAGFDKAKLMKDAKNPSNVKAELPPVIKITVHVVTKNDSIDPPSVAYYKIIQKLDPNKPKTFKCHCENCKCTECLKDSKESSKLANKCKEFKCLPDNCCCPEDTNEDKNKLKTLKCMCGKCDCIKCLLKCMCGKCTCINCPKVRNESPKSVSNNKIIETIDPNKPKTVKCHCENCKCTQCLKDSKESSKLANKCKEFKCLPENCCCPEDTNENENKLKALKCMCRKCACIKCPKVNNEPKSLCVNCKCLKCPLKCMCGKCTCVKCPKVRNESPKSDANYKIIEKIDPNKPKTVKCHCENCKCTECGKESSKSPLKCMCGKCTCINCPKVRNGSPKGDTNESKCRCNNCTCPRGTKKPPHEVENKETLKCVCDKCPCKINNELKSPPLKFKCHCSPCKCNNCCDAQRSKLTMPRKLCNCVKCDCTSCLDPPKKDNEGIEEFRIFIKGLDQTRVMNDTTKNQPVASIFFPKEIKMSMYAVTYADNKCIKMEPSTKAMYELVEDTKSIKLPPIINLDLQATNKSGTLELSSEAMYQFRKPGCT